MTKEIREGGVRLERRGDVLEVTLARPEVRNAQTPATWRSLAAIPSELDEQIRFVVIRGEGAGFSAGLDRGMLSPEGIPGEESLWSLAQRGADAIEGMIRSAQDAFTWWREVPQVTIALVHGHAIGAGLQLALACDLMIVTPDAQLAMRETSLGLVPDLGGTGTLVDRVGYPRALEMCITGRFLGGAEAVQCGLALATVEADQWDDHLATLLTPVRQCLPGAVSEIKHLLQGATYGPDQLVRERSAQVRRLHELAALASGG